MAKLLCVHWEPESGCPGQAGSLITGEQEMKIAVASQNRREVTGHTGRCRKFWFYDIEQGKVQHKVLLELPKEQSLHDSSRHAAHPLEVADVLISAGMGQGLVRRLAAWGIEAVVTPVPDPDAAVAHYLAGTLPPDGQHRQQASQCSCHSHPD
jgi:predicted Fe-Mo cluster-binding NifX family protein